MPWHASADGWWHSAALEVSVQPAHPILSVRDRDGAIVEPAGVVRRQQRERERQQRELEQRLAAGGGCMDRDGGPASRLCDRHRVDSPVR